MLIHTNDDIEFVTEFPCFLGQTVSNQIRQPDKMFLVLY